MYKVTCKSRSFPSRSYPILISLCMLMFTSQATIVPSFRDDIIWASSRENLSSGCPTKRVSNQSPQLQRLAREIEISPVASLQIILSKTRIIKALIRLRGCAGWSAPVLFANPRRQVFSRRGPYLPRLNWY